MNGMTEGRNICYADRGTTSASAEQDALMPRCYVLQQENDDLECGTGDRRLCVTANLVSWSIAGMILFIPHVDSGKRQKRSTPTSSNGWRGGGRACSLPVVRHFGRRLVPLGG